MPLKPLICLSLYLATFHLVSAQYREFTNTKGKSVVAMPLKKTTDGVLVKTDEGKKYTLKYAILSSSDVEFLKAWERPEFSHSVKEYGRPSSNSQTQADDCIVEIFLLSKTTNEEGQETEVRERRVSFGAKTEREIEQALEMFAGTLRHKDKFLEKNTLLGDNYNLALNNFNKKFPEGLSWSISVHAGNLTLVGQGQGRLSREQVSVNESEAPYILDYLTDIDADRMIKAYLRIKSRN